MFKQLHLLVGGYGAPEAVHREMEGRIVALHGRQERFGNDVDIELLFDFAHDAFFRRFARLHFPAGKFPAVLKVAVAALRGKNAALMMKNGRAHFDSLHFAFSPVMYS